MENKVYLKKTIIKILIISLFLTISFTILNIFEYRIYIKNYNNKLISISNAIKEYNPDIKESKIIDIINSNNMKDNIFKKYNYDLEKESIIEENNCNFIIYLIFELFIVILTIGIITYLYLKYNSNKDKEIKDIIKLIDKINHHNYEIDIDNISEDELSILKNEIYKTTIMLRSIADNSIKDKNNLKETLEDISHQLKTPLTSIIINLDNILDNSNISKDKEDEFLRKIKKDIYNIKTLVDNLLKLSKFDVNTITYNKNEEFVKDIIDLSIQNVSSLADLKNIKIEVNGNKKSKFICDKMWEVEAITNILKNAIEHSYENDIVTISYDSNQVYNSIAISNNGDTISSRDLKHLFDRFYKGENSSKDSIGIGLALAKTIIENDNGNISVESNNEKTKFTIKYFKI